LPAAKMLEAQQCFTISFKTCTSDAGCPDCTVTMQFSLCIEGS